MSLLSLFSKVQYKLCVSVSRTRDLWCFKCLEFCIFSISQHPTFCPSLQLQLQTPDVILSSLLFLYLFTMITAFHQQTKIPATLLFCSFKITVTRQRRISVDIIFFLIECTGVYLDSILQGQLVILGISSSLAFSSDCRITFPTAEFIQLLQEASLKQGDFTNGSITQKKSGTSDVTSYPKVLMLACFESSHCVFQLSALRLFPNLTNICCTMQ